MATPPVIDLKGITKLYRLGSTVIQALAGVDLSVDNGEYVSIMGPSGCGKSTLLNILGLLDRPNGGSYFFDGTDIAGLVGQNCFVRIECLIESFGASIVKCQLKPVSIAEVRSYRANHIFKVLDGRIKVFFLGGNLCLKQNALQVVFVDL